MKLSGFTLRSSRYSTSVPPEVPQPSSTGTAQSFNGDSVSTFLGFFVLMSSFVLLLFSMRNWKTSQETPTISQEMKKWSDKLVFDLPCRHCQYFHANRFLACAVNPTQVLTAEAAHCNDFKAKEPLPQAPPTHRRST